MTLRNTAKILMQVLMVIGLASFCTVNAQNDDESKDIKAEVFVNARPRRKSGSTAKYHRVSKTTAKGIELSAKDSSSAQIGLTIWRFRPAQASDKTKELVVEDEDKPSEWTLERVEEGTSLAPGQRIRLSIESLSRDGYLYVVDREQYADGTLGDPVLVFPTQKSASANYVQAGRLIYLPSATGRFKIKPSESSKEHVAEVLTVIVAPKPLISADRLGLKSTRLQRGQVEDWLKEWETSAVKFEMDGGVGQAMTPVEQSAAQQNSVILSQEDPAPQTVFQVAARPGNPLLITVPLKFTRRN
ncbi:MAG TPA: hypothetical protein VF088_20945 [Pyrinomonadaceae bacterium]